MGETTRKEVMKSQPTMMYKDVNPMIDERVAASVLVMDIPSTEPIMRISSNSYRDGNFLAMWRIINMPGRANDIKPKIRRRTPLNSLMYDSSTKSDIKVAIGKLVSSR